jgi:hypothetical protein
LFTGTPLLKADKKTSSEIFGPYPNLQIRRGRDWRRQIIVSEANLAQRESADANSSAIFSGDLSNRWTIGCPNVSRCP